MAVMIAEILLSLFAVFGLYAAVRLLAARFGNASLFVAVVLQQPLSPEEVELRLLLAHEQFFLQGYPTIALVDAAIADDPTLVALLSRWVDVYYVVEDLSR